MYVITAGVPQGSVLGPLLWNYNGVLRLPVAKQVVVVRFVDDVGVVIISNYPDEVQICPNETIRTIKSWLKNHGLELAEHKTELVLFTKRRKQKSVEICIEVHIVSSQPSLKYLGVIFDCKLSKPKAYWAESGENQLNTGTDASKCRRPEAQSAITLIASRQL